MKINEIIDNHFSDIFEKQLLNLKKKVKNTIKGVKRLERLSNKNRKQNRKQNNSRDEAWPYFWCSASVLTNHW